jgi:predicted nucleic acid-binding protein
MKALFDTNILIDHLCGHPQAEAFWTPYTDRLISRITVMEVMAGADTAQEEQAARTLLATFRIVELDAPLSETTISLRKSHPKKMKLPDAIIYASARSQSCPLVTRNVQDFGGVGSDVIEPYILP